jgi:IS5 family transposase
LSDLGDQLVAYGRVVDFEAFRPTLEKALALCERAARWSAALISGHDNMMLKVLVIQTANALSDERTRFLINDRLIHAQGGPLRSGG